MYKLHDSKFKFDVSIVRRKKCIKAKIRLKLHLFRKQKSVTFSTLSSPSKPDAKQIYLLQMSAFQKAKIF